MLSHDTKLKRRETDTNTLPIPQLYSSLHAHLMQWIEDECESRLTNLVWIMMGIYQAASVRLTKIARKTPVRPWYAPVAR